MQSHASRKRRIPVNYVIDAAGYAAYAGKCVRVGEPNVLVLGARWANRLPEIYFCEFAFARLECIWLQILNGTGVPRGTQIDVFS